MGGELVLREVKCVEGLFLYFLGVGCELSEPVFVLCPHLGHQIPIFGMTPSGVY